MRIFVAALLIQICFFNSTAQIAPGEWRDHLSYRLAQNLAYGDNKVYCATSHSLFFYDLTDNSINKLSKVQGLSYNSIDKIEYIPSQKALIIAYSNSSIDVLRNNKISNIPYIKNKVDLTNKKINNISIINDLAYLSCGYGISILDIDKNLVKSTYFPGSESSINEVFDVCSDGTNIYAVTRNGIYKGALNDPFLMDNSHWTLIKSLGNNLKNSNIEYYDNKLFALVSTSPGTMTDSVVIYDGYNWTKMDIALQNIYSISQSGDKLFISGTYSVFLIEAGLKRSQMFTAAPRYALQDKEQHVWCADYGLGLVNLSSGLSFFPDGPMYPENVKIDLKDDNIWTVAGALDAEFQWQYNNRGLASYTNDKWNFFTPYNIENMLELRDLINVKVNPQNPQQVYMASYQSGLLEYNNGKFKLYKSENTTIQADYLQTDTKNVLNLWSRFR